MSCAYNGQQIEPLIQTPFIVALQNRDSIKTLSSAHRVYLCVSYCPQNKERSFPYTALTGCSL
jgi:hypothetical protein